MEIMAYEFDGTGGIGILQCLSKYPNRISKSKLIPKKQNEKILNLVNNEGSYGQSIAFCFDPHLGIVYRNHGEIVNAIDFCLDCNYLESTFAIPAMDKHSEIIEGDTINRFKGFSPEMRKEINGICKELEFLTYLKPLESVFDRN